MDNFTKTACKFESIPASWDICSKRANTGEWTIEASIWMDNGYGGRKCTIEGKNKSLQKAMKEVLDKIDEHTIIFGHRYH